MPTSAPPSASHPGGGPRADEIVEDVTLANGSVRRQRFDLVGRLLRQDEPDATWLRFHYGLDANLECVEHSSGESVEYEVDATAHTWRARTARAETLIYLDRDGLPERLVQRVDGRDLAFDEVEDHLDVVLEGGRAQR